jgi:DNA-binding NarL/FixJ family response regulator
MNRISVALVEDDPHARERFASAIASAPELELRAAFDNGKDALRWLEHQAVDVLLTDLGLPDIPGLAVLTYCARRHPACDILVITIHDEPVTVLRCIEAGATGYLLKDSLHDGIVRHILEVRQGGAPMTPAIARQVLLRFRVDAGKQAQPSEDEPTLLTQREMVILSRVSQGFRYAEIAELENISPHTVHTHVKRIYAKLSVHSRSEAVYEAAQLGLIDPARAGPAALRRGAGNGKP